MKYISKLCNQLTGSSRQGDRLYMEDKISVAYNELDGSKEDGSKHEYLFIGIFDGHGGVEAADYAKKHLVQNITRQRNFWSHNEKDVLRAIREGKVCIDLVFFSLSYIIHKHNTETNE